jgi:putative SOS response-associated peptidase YedK
MCGRLVQSSPVALVRTTFRASGPDVDDDTGPSFNVAPSGRVLTVAGTPDGRRVGRLHWGLVPSFAMDPKKGPRAINLRAETVATKFAKLVARRRCIVPADGFYEWSGEGTGRAPWFVRAPDGSLLALAAIWDRWRRGGDELVSFAILTCAANELVREIHDRMPVILAGEALERWLDPAEDDPPTLAGLLGPASPGRLEAWPVSRDVNSPRNDAPSLVRPAGPVRLTAAARPDS